MALGLLDYFLLMTVLVFILSGLILLLAVRSGPSDTPSQTPEDENSNDKLAFDALEELAEAISGDKELLKVVSPLVLPHIDLPGAKLGGGALDEACSKSVGTIVLDSDNDPNERRRSNRRMTDRRRSDSEVVKERRMVQRRIWLRRQEDHHRKQLLSVTDAAETLGVPVEQIYKWLDNADIPFYQVTENKRKTIKFDIDELLRWYSVYTSGGNRQG